MIRLVRTAYGSSSAYSGVEVAVGRAAGWQTDGDHVGRFATSLDPDEASAIEEAASAVSSAHIDVGAGDGAPTAAPATAPSGVVEQLFIDDDVALVIDPFDGGDAEVQSLVDRLRSLQEKLVTAPVAGLRLVVEGSPLGVSLRHVGDAELEVRTEEVVMTANLWNGDGELVGSVSAEIELATAGPIPPGWTSELAPVLDLPELEPGGYGTVTVSGLTADVLGDGVMRPCELGWWIE